MMKKMLKKNDVKELVAGYMKGDKKTDEEVEMEGLNKVGKKRLKRDLHLSMFKKMLTHL